MHDKRGEGGEDRCVGWENVTPAPLPLPLPLFLPLSLSLFLFLSLSLSLSIALLDWRSTVSKIPRKILVSPLTTRAGCDTIRV